jgi:hypothetical protein
MPKFSRQLKRFGLNSLLYVRPTLSFAACLRVFVQHTITLEHSRPKQFKSIRNPSHAGINPQRRQSWPSYTHGVLLVGIYLETNYAKGGNADFPKFSKDSFLQFSLDRKLHTYAQECELIPLQIRAQKHSRSGNKVRTSRCHNYITIM